MADARKVFISTLGCDKNTVDSEQMLGGLIRRGYKPTDDAANASLIIVNTCCFIEAAKRESIDRIFAYLPYRTDDHGACDCFVVAGCMAQRYADELREEIPEVDYFIGVNQIDELPAVLSENGTRKDYVDDHFAASTAPRYVRPKTTTEFIKISEGCDNHCTYCAIPAIRGRHHSRKPEEIIAEAKILYQSGVRELVIVAQNTTQYGSDLNEPINLAKLLDQLADAVPFTWIRVLYMYPEGITDELLDVMASHSNICHYFDMPIQHTENEILKRMGRHIDKAEIYDKVGKIRNVMPDAVLRTTVIAGFPGETEEQFAAMLASLKELSFDRLGAFAYSREEGTPAYDMPDQIPESTKEARVAAVYEQQESITAAKNDRMIGKKCDVLIDEIQDDGVAICRTRGDAPDVDCDVIIETGTKRLKAGQFVDVRIVDAVGFDLIGEITTGE